MVGTLHFAYSTTAKEIIHMLASQRDLFEMPRHICYLNAASYSPLPLRTQEAGRAAVGRKGTPWTLDAAFANGQHERARVAAARLINADPADIALIPSVSYGVATAAKILTIDRQDIETAQKTLEAAEAKKDPLLVKEWTERIQQIAQALVSSPQPKSHDDSDTWKRRVET